MSISSSSITASLYLERGFPFPRGPWPFQALPVASHRNIYCTFFVCLIWFPGFTIPHNYGYSFVKRITRRRGLGGWLSGAIARKRWVKTSAFGRMRKSSSPRLLSERFCFLGRYVIIGLAVVLVLVIVIVTYYLLYTHNGNGGEEENKIKLASSQLQYISLLSFLPSSPFYMLYSGRREFSPYSAISLSALSLSFLLLSFCFMHIIIIIIIMILSFYLFLMISPKRRQTSV